MASTVSTQVSRGRVLSLKSRPCCRFPSPCERGGGARSPLRTYPHADDPQYAWNYQAGCYSRLCESCRFEFAAWWDMGFAVCPRCHGGGR